MYQTTEDYSQFKFLPFNRETTEAHIQRMIDSIEDMGVIRPVVVSQFTLGGEEGLYILDGQHLFKALQRRGESISYHTIEVESQRDMVMKIAKLNNSSKTWTLTDYAVCFSSLNRREYIKLLEVKKATGLSLSTVIDIYGMNPTTSLKYVNSTNSYKEGNFEFYNESASDFAIEELKRFQNKFGKLSSNVLLGLSYLILQQNYDFITVCNGIRKLKNRLHFIITATSFVLAYNTVQSE